jgi:hypothetical protein
MKPEEVVRTTIRKGYNAIGVVDHNSIKGGLEAKKIAGKRLLVIPGEEIKTDRGDVIVFLSDGKYNRNLIDVCERCREMGHFLVIPHPFDFLRFRSSILQGIGKAKNIDAIETFNSRVLIDKFNTMAKNFSKNNKIPQIVGSDAHFYEEIGNAKAFLDCEKNIDSIFNYVRKNKIKFEGKKSGFYPHLKTFLLRFNK